MQALPHCADLQVKVEKSVHTFFYKGIEIERFAYNGENKCPYNCVCQKGSTWQHDPINQQISLYLTKLCKMSYTEFTVTSPPGTTVLWIHGNRIFCLAKKEFKWDDNLALDNNLVPNRIEIFPDRLEIKIIYGSLLTFYKDQPFHKEILDQLRHHLPFSDAPVWF